MRRGRDRLRKDSLFYDGLLGGVYEIRFHMIRDY